MLEEVNSKTVTTGTWTYSENILHSCLQELYIAHLHVLYPKSACVEQAITKEEDHTFLSVVDQTDQTLHSWHVGIVLSSKWTLTLSYSYLSRSMQFAPQRGTLQEEA